MEQTKIHPGGIAAESQMMLLCYEPTTIKIKPYALLI
jgi:hypothetical protein